MTRQPASSPAEQGASLGDYLLSLPQYLLPHHALSRLVLRATRVRQRAWKNLLIRQISRHYRIDLEEAVSADPDHYASFNDFFTRPLKPGVRPLDPRPDRLLSPVDGRVSQAGTIEATRIFQAKGRDYSLLELLGGQTDSAEPFRDGRFATLYLSPRDYHRIHMPLAGTLRRTIYVPGRLFSVAPHTVRSVPRLFARNERLVSLFDTAAGPMALVAVGALFVSCIETVWSGIETPPHGHRVRVRDFPAEGPGSVHLTRGAEMGRFNMGSTVILLFGPEAVAWEAGVRPDAALRMGQAIGRLLQPAATPDTGP
ncbi:archaetidylserine decarboxylase [Thiohalobacter sp. IOR34]|uniref:archaetidylserine decarboxylase n=1 Tax=Thiohalobacter sp. IOR34 TaxID=3057176 RepID=UPI0025B192FF|nr:archaetidylserine decarboxylase [Thiohalobacter sp. IOR34]WJW74529.1 archaetidylserine decarboxylase [Thiohalobacter sp. IOR34]